MDRQTAEVLKKAMAAAMKAFQDTIDASVIETEKIAKQKAAMEAAKPAPAPTPAPAPRPSPVTEPPKAAPSASSFAPPVPNDPTQVVPVVVPAATHKHVEPPKPAPKPIIPPDAHKAKKFDGLL